MHAHINTTNTTQMDVWRRQWRRWWQRHRVCKLYAHCTHINFKQPNCSRKLSVCNLWVRARQFAIVLGVRVCALKQQCAAILIYCIVSLQYSHKIYFIYRK